MNDFSQCQCHCMTDEGSCPHTNFIQSKFNVYWDEMETSVDSILCKYSKDNIREFIDYDTVRRGNKQSNASYNKSTQSNMEKITERMTKVYNVSLQKLYVDRNKNNIPSRPSTSSTIISDHHHTDSLPRLKLDSSQEKKRNTLSRQQQQRIQRKGNSHSITSVSVDGFPQVDDSFSSSWVATSKSVNTIVTNTTNTNTHTINNQLIQRMDENITKPSIILTTEINDVKNLLCLDAQRDYARTMFGSNIILDNEKIIPSKEGWIASPPKILPTCHLHDNNSYYNSGNNGSSMIDISSFIVDGEHDDNNEQDDNNHITNNQEQEDRIVGYKTNHHPTYHLAGLIGISDMIISKTLPWQAMKCPKALENLNSLHNTISKVKYHEPTLLKMTHQIEENISNFIIKQDITIESWINEEIILWQKSIDQEKSLLSKFYSDSEEAKNERRLRHEIGLKVCELQFIEELNFMECKDAKNRLDDVLSQYDGSINHTTPNLSNTQISHIDTSSSIALNNTILSTSLIHEVKNYKSLEDHLALRVSMRRREEANEWLTTLGENSTIAMDGDEHLQLHVDLFEAEKKRIIELCKKEIEIYKKEYEIIEVVIQDYADRIHEYSSDYIHRELCINQAFQCMILSILSSLDQPSIHDSNIHVHNSNNLSSKPNTSSTYSTLPSILSQAKPTSSDETYETIFEWKSKFVMDRYKKKNRELYVINQKYIRSTFDKVISDCKQKVKDSYHRIKDKILSIQTMRMEEIENRKSSLRKQLMKHVNNSCGERRILLDEILNNQQNKFIQDENQIRSYHNTLSNIETNALDLWNKLRIKQSEVLDQNKYRMNTLKDKIIQLFRKLVQEISIAIPIPTTDSILPSTPLLSHHNNTLFQGKGPSYGMGENDPWVQNVTASIRHYGDIGYIRLRDSFERFQSNDMRNAIDNYLYRFQSSGTIGSILTNTMANILNHNNINNYGALHSNHTEEKRSTTATTTTTIDVSLDEAEQNGNRVSSDTMVIDTTELSNPITTEVILFSTMQNYPTYPELLKESDLLESTLTDWKAMIDSYTKSQIASIESYYKLYRKDYMESYQAYIDALDIYIQKKIVSIHLIEEEIMAKVEEALLLYETEDTLFEQISCNAWEEFWNQAIESIDKNIVWDHNINNNNSNTSNSNEEDTEKSSDQISERILLELNGNSNSTNSNSNHLYHEFLRKLTSIIENALYEYNTSENDMMMRNNRYLPSNVTMKCLITTCEWFWKHSDLLYHIKKHSSISSGSSSSSNDDDDNNENKIALFSIGTSLQILSRIPIHNLRTRQFYSSDSNNNGNNNIEINTKLGISLDTVECMDVSVDDLFGLCSVSTNTTQRTMDKSNRNHIQEAMIIGLELMLTYPILMENLSNPMDNKSNKSKNGENSLLTYWDESIFFEILWTCKVMAIEPVLSNPTLSDRIKGVNKISYGIQFSQPKELFDNILHNAIYDTTDNTTITTTNSKLYELLDNIKTSISATDVLILSSLLNYSNYCSHSSHSTDKNTIAITTILSLWRQTAKCMLLAITDMSYKLYPKLSDLSFTEINVASNMKSSYFNCNANTNANTNTTSEVRGMSSFHAMSQTLEMVANIPYVPISTLQSLCFLSRDSTSCDPWIEDSNQIISNRVQNTFNHELNRFVRVLSSHLTTSQENITNLPMFMPKSSSMFSILSTLNSSTDLITASKISYSVPITFPENLLNRLKSYDISDSNIIPLELLRSYIMNNDKNIITESERSILFWCLSRYRNREGKSKSSYSSYHRIPSITSNIKSNQTIISSMPIYNLPTYEFNGLIDTISSSDNYLKKFSEAIGTGLVGNNNKNTSNTTNFMFDIASTIGLHKNENYIRNSYAILSDSIIQNGENSSSNNSNNNNISNININEYHHSTSMNDKTTIWSYESNIPILDAINILQDIEYDNRMDNYTNNTTVTNPFVHLSRGLIELGIINTYTKAYDRQKQSFEQEGIFCSIQSKNSSSSTSTTIDNPTIYWNKLSQNRYSHIKDLILCYRNHIQNQWAYGIHSLRQHRYHIRSNGIHAIKYSIHSLKSSYANEIISDRILLFEMYNKLYTILSNTENRDKLILSNQANLFYDSYKKFQSHAMEAMNRFNLCVHRFHSYSKAIDIPIKSQIKSKRIAYSTLLDRIGDKVSNHFHSHIQSIENNTLSEYIKSIDTAYQNITNEIFVYKESYHNIKKSLGENLLKDIRQLLPMRPSSAKSYQNSQILRFGDKDNGDKNNGDKNGIVSNRILPNKRIKSKGMNKIRGKDIPISSKVLDNDIGLPNRRKSLFDRRDPIVEYPLHPIEENSNSLASDSIASSSVKENSETQYSIEQSSVEQTSVAQKTIDTDILSSIPPVYKYGYGYGVEYGVQYSAYPSIYISHLKEVLDGKEDDRLSDWSGVQTINDDNASHASYSIAPSITASVDPSISYSVSHLPSQTNAVTQLKPIPKRSYTYPYPKDDLNLYSNDQVHSILYPIKLNRKDTNVSQLSDDNDMSIWTDIRTNDNDATHASYSNVPSNLTSAITSTLTSNVTSLASSLQSSAQTSPTNGGGGNGSIMSGKYSLSKKSFYRRVSTILDADESREIQSESTEDHMLPNSKPYNDKVYESSIENSIENSMDCDSLGYDSIDYSSLDDNNNNNSLDCNSSLDNNSSLSNNSNSMDYERDQTIGENIKKVLGNRISYYDNGSEINVSSNSNSENQSVVLSSEDKSAISSVNISPSNSMSYNENSQYYSNGSLGTNSQSYVENSLSYTTEYYPNTSQSIESYDDIQSSTSRYSMDSPSIYTKDGTESIAESVDESVSESVDYSIASSVESKSRRMFHSSNTSISNSNSNSNDSSVYNSMSGENSSSSKTSASVIPYKFTVPSYSIQDTVRNVVNSNAMDVYTKETIHKLSDQSFFDNLIPDSNPTQSNTTSILEGIPSIRNPAYPMSASEKAMEENIHPGKIFDYIIIHSDRIQKLYANERIGRERIQYLIDTKINKALTKTVHDIISFYDAIEDTTELIPEVAKESKIRFYEGRLKCENFLLYYYKEFHRHRKVILYKQSVHSNRMNNILRNLSNRWSQTKNLCIGIIDTYRNEILQDLSAMKLKIYNIIESFREKNLERLYISQRKAKEDIRNALYTYAILSNTKECRMKYSNKNSSSDYSDYNSIGYGNIVECYSPMRDPTMNTSTSEKESITTYSYPIESDTEQSNTLVSNKVEPYPMAELESQWIELILAYKKDIRKLSYELKDAWNRVLMEYQNEEKNFIQYNKNDPILSSPILSNPKAKYIFEDIIDKNASNHDADMTKVEENILSDNIKPESPDKKSSLLKKIKSSNKLSSIKNFDKSKTLPANISTNINVDTLVIEQQSISPITLKKSLSSVPSQSPQKSPIKSFTSFPTKSVQKSSKKSPIYKNNNNNNSNNKNDKNGSGSSNNSVVIVEDFWLDMKYQQNLLYQLENNLRAEYLNLEPTILSSNTSDTKINMNNSGSNSNSNSNHINTKNRRNSLATDGNKKTSHSKSKLSKALAYRNSRTSNNNNNNNNNAVNNTSVAVESESYANNMMYNPMPSSNLIREINLSNDVSNLFVSYPIEYYKTILLTLPEQYNVIKNDQFNEIYTISHIESNTSDELFIRPQVSCLLNLLVTEIEVSCDIEDSYGKLIGFVENKTNSILSDIETYSQKIYSATMLSDDSMLSDKSMISNNIQPNQSILMKSIDAYDHSSLKPIYDAAALLSHRDKEMSALLESVQNHIYTDQSRHNMLSNTTMKAIEDWYLNSLMSLHRTFSEAEDRYALEKIPNHPEEEEFSKIESTLDRNNIDTKGDHTNTNTNDNNSNSNENSHSNNNIGTNRIIYSNQKITIEENMMPMGLVSDYMTIPYPTSKPKPMITESDQQQELQQSLFESYAKTQHPSHPIFKTINEPVEHLISQQPLTKESRINKDTDDVRSISSNLSIESYEKSYKKLRDLIKSSKAENDLHMFTPKDMNYSMTNAITTNNTINSPKTIDLENSVIEDEDNLNTNSNENPNTNIIGFDSVMDVSTLSGSLPYDLGSSTSYANSGFDSPSLLLLTTKTPLDSQFVSPLQSTLQSPTDSYVKSTRTATNSTMNSQFQSPIHHSDENTNSYTTNDSVSYFSESCSYSLSKSGINPSNPVESNPEDIFTQSYISSNGSNEAFSSLNDEDEENKKDRRSSNDNSQLVTITSEKQEKDGHVPNKHDKDQNSSSSSIANNSQSYLNHNSTSYKFEGIDYTKDDVANYTTDYMNLYPSSNINTEPNIIDQQPMSQYGFDQSYASSATRSTIYYNHETLTPTSQITLPRIWQNNNQDHNTTISYEHRKEVIHQIQSEVDNITHTAIISALHQNHDKLPYEMDKKSPTTSSQRYETYSNVYELPSNRTSSRMGGNRNEDTQIMFDQNPSISNSTKEFNLSDKELSSSLSLSSSSLKASELLNSEKKSIRLDKKPILSVATSPTKLKQISDKYDIKLPSSTSIKSNILSPLQSKRSVPASIKGNYSNSNSNNNDNNNITTKIFVPPSPGGILPGVAGRIIPSTPGYTIPTTINLDNPISPGTTKSNSGPMLSPKYSNRAYPTKITAFTPNSSQKNKPLESTKTSKSSLLTNLGTKAAIVESESNINKNNNTNIVETIQQRPSIIGIGITNSFESPKPSSSSVLSIEVDAIINSALGGGKNANSASPLIITQSSSSSSSLENVNMS